MLLAIAAALVVYLIALAAVAGIAAAVCRRVGQAPMEVLVWFGLAEAAPVHPWHRDRSRRFMLQA